MPRPGNLDRPLSKKRFAYTAIKNRSSSGTASGGFCRMLCAFVGGVVLMALLCSQLQAYGIIGPWARGATTHDSNGCVQVEFA